MANNIYNRGRRAGWTFDYKEIEMQLVGCYCSAWGLGGKKHWDKDFYHIFPKGNARNHVSLIGKRKVGNHPERVREHLPVFS